MAKGRKALPAKIHQLHGTYREDRHGKGIQLDSILPEPPERLTEVARLEWRRVAKELHDAGILTSLDLTALEMYCTVFAQWVEAHEEMRKRPGGMVSSTPNGYKQQSAWFQVANVCLKQMQGLLSEFGMTPATRARLKLIEEQPKQLDILSLLDEVSQQRAGGNG